MYKRIVFIIISIFITLSFSALDFKVGETIHYAGGVSVTLKSVRFAMIDNTSFAENNYILCLLNLYIENNSSDEITVSSMLQFELKDKYGNSYNQYLYNLKGLKSLDGKIPKKGETNGFVAYEVPPEAQDLRLFFDFDFQNIEDTSFFIGDVAGNRIKK